MLSLEKGVGLYLKNKLFPYQWMAFAKFGWSWSSCPEEEIVKMKRLQTEKQTNRQTDKLS